MTRRRIIVVGATSAIAERCVRLWLQEEAADVMLAGRDAAKLERVGADLRVRSPQCHVETRVVEFHDPAVIAATVDSMVASAPADIVLIAQGSLPDQQQCQSDLHAVETALQINAVSPALFAEAFARHMQQANRGTLVVIGSVAGDRGRKKNYVYGAAKGLLDRYVEGLQHRFAATPVHVVLAKPGPTDTPMTSAMKERGGKLASPDDVAAQIVRGAARGTPVIYAPLKWRLIMLVIRHLPRFIFDKLDI